MVAQKPFPPSVADGGKVENGELGGHERELLTPREKELFKGGRRHMPYFTSVADRMEERGLESVVGGPIPWSRPLTFLADGRRLSHSAAVGPAHLK